MSDKSIRVETHNTSFRLPEATIQKLEELSTSSQAKLGSAFKASKTQLIVQAIDELHARLVGPTTQRGEKP